MARYKLPSGAKVTIRDVDTLKARDSKVLMGKMSASAQGVDTDNDEALAEAGIGVFDELIALLVTDWDIPYPTEDGRPWLLPKIDHTLIDELTGADYGALMSIVKPAQEVLMPQKTDPSEYEDLDSPTAPANA